MNEPKVSGKQLYSQLTDTDVSAMRRYQAIALGTNSLLYMIKFELIMLFVSGLPGAPGLLLRKFLFPAILGSVGKNVVFGRNLSIRHGLKIRIGDNVVFDDNVTLDAKGEDNRGISIGSDCILSRNAILSCKNGNITVGSGCMIGINVLIHAIQGSDVTLGDKTLLAAFVYLMGSGSYITDDPTVPFKDQGIIPRGGIVTQSNVWIGSNVQVLDGVTIGTGAIVGSSAVVNKNVASHDVVAGVPIKVIRSRLD
jgi:acetyltransferase-like isoleucine patch superfamily enzyme